MTEWVVKEDIIKGKHGFFVGNAAGEHKGEFDDRDRAQEYANYLNRSHVDGDELYRRGVKGTNFKERSIEQCLNCKKPVCNGCPITEVDQYGRGGRR